MFHEKGGRGGRTNGAKRSIVVESLGLPLAVQVESARPHDVSAGRRLLDGTLSDLGSVKAIVADRGYRAHPTAFPLKYSPGNVAHP